MIESCKVDKNTRFKALRNSSFFMLVLLIVLFAGCEKVEESADFTTIALPESGLVRTFYREGDTVFIAGGETHSNGFLLAYDLNTDQISTIVSGYQHSFYSVSRNPLNGLLYLGMDNSDLLIVDGDGDVGEHYIEEQYWVNDQQKQPLHEAHEINSRLFYIGGGELQFGLIRKQLDNDQFQQYEFNNELRSLVFLGGNKLLAVGNGIQITSNDLGETWTRKSSPSAYFTSVCYDENSATGWMTTFQGGIYKTSDGGENWNREQTPISTLRSPFYLKRIKLLNSNNYDAIAVGNNGSLAVKQTDKSWELIHLSLDDDLSDFIIINNQLWIAAKGKLIIYPL